MSFPPRRVVTGHDPEGRPIVASDSIAENVTTLREGHRSYVMWATDRVPADNSGPDDAALGPMPRSIESGTIFRITEYAPGVVSSPHQTDSVDYAVVISGAIEMRVDGESVRLGAGDVLVQRGTAHDWVNNGTEPCVIAFCLVGAQPRSD
jgi:mannose-6-phosphate isomerase-like protein (cupin superfamily)